MQAIDFRRTPRIRNCIGHKRIGHNYIGHNYTGHNYTQAIAMQAIDFPPNAEKPYDARPPNSECEILTPVSTT